MARYIDADKVHEGIEALQISLESNNDAIWEKNKPYYKGLAMARGVINDTPTADVAPRAEVAREIFEEIEQTCRVCGAFGVRGYIMDDVANLKKKYTEARNESKST